MKTAVAAAAPDPESHIRAITELVPALSMTYTAPALSPYAMALSEIRDRRRRIGADVEYLRSLPRRMETLERLDEAHRLALGYDQVIERLERK